MFLKLYFPECRSEKKWEVGGGGKNTGIKKQESK